MGEHEKDRTAARSDAARTDAAPSDAAIEDRGDPTTQQLRTVGQRRREAERKLDIHLEEASHKGEAPPNAGEGHSEG
ncbi:hypothetical protein [Arthrobacter sp. YN]|uniref:hypothetical protein n=1 Tax=Arthrobacter sp. YN TaxID=2020486 RepID=UPI000B61D5CD|nr:hypothetical protein [Arthrobacter sp. YN]ASN22091.1 hypothetical protein CGK93_22320 [Arthrobacter sp. YN]